MDEDDLEVGLFEAIENAVDYFLDRGLEDQAILRVLSIAYKAHKDSMLQADIKEAVEDLLEDIFGETGGTE